MNKQQTTQIQWKEIELKEILKFIRNGINIEQLDEGEYPVTRIETIWNSKIDIKRVKYCNPTKEIINKYKLLDGDILFSHINSPSHIGKTAIYEGEPKILIHGINLLLIRSLKNIVFPKYLDYYFKSKEVRSFFEMRCKKSVNQASLNQGDILKIKIPIPYRDNKPDLETQKRIVEKLELAEKLKENRKKADELTKEYLNSVFLEMFGDPFKNSFSWKKEELKKHVILINGRAYSQHELLDSGTQIIRIQNLNGGNNWYYSNLNLPENKYCNKGDLLFAWSGTFGPFIWNSERSIYHYHIWKLELKNSINKNYIYYFLSLLSENIKKSGHGGIITHKTKESMDKLLIPIPPIQLQNEFAKIVEQVEQLKEFQLKSKEEIDNLYNKLMQQAFKGEL